MNYESQWLMLLSGLRLTWIQGSAPVHSIVMSGIQPSFSSASFAICCGVMSLVTNMTSSAPHSSALNWTISSDQDKLNNLVCSLFDHVSHHNSRCSHCFGWKKRNKSNRSTSGYKNGMTESYSSSTTSMNSNRQRLDKGCFFVCHIIYIRLSTRSDLV